MIENWKQVSLANEGMWQSALWIENYNPNLETNTLVKRYGLKQAYLNLQDDLVTPDYLGVQLQNKLLLNSSLTIDKDIVNHCKYFEVSNPDYWKGLVIFGKRLIEYKYFPDQRYTEFYPDTYPLSQGFNALGIQDGLEATGIIGYLREYIDNERHEIGWWEVFSDNENDFTIPMGWFPFGYFKDASLYGESISFVTLLEHNKYTRENVLTGASESTPWAHFMYPCYVYHRWDISEKRKEGNDRLWNGIILPNAYPNKKIYSRWLVKMPTQNFINETNIISVSRYNNATNDYDIIDGLPEPDIELLFSESDYHVHELGNIMDIDDGLNTKDYADSIANNLSFHTYKEEELGERRLLPTLDPNHIFTLDVPRIKDYEALLQAESPELQFIPTRYGEVNDTATDKIKYLVSDYGIDGYIFGCYSSDGHLIHAVPHALLNYAEIKKPRQWMRKEQIPYIITVKIDGIEIVIKKGIYDISDHRAGTVMHMTEAELRAMPLEINSYDFKYFSDNRYTKQWLVGPFTVDIPEVCTIMTTMQTCQSPNIAKLTSGTDMYAVHGSVLEYNIRIKASSISKLLKYNLEEINIYVSQPHETKSILRSIGIYKPSEPPPILYHFPASVDNADPDDYSDFRLVHSYKTEGLNNIIDWDIYQGESTAQNAWYHNQADDYIYAVPTDENNVPYNVRPKDNHNFPDDGVVDTTLFYHKPNFILWDYPVDSMPLALQYSGKNWKGRGAKNICVIKNVTFLGGCIDEDGKEEQAIVRYPLIQNGIASRDLFPEENEMQVGHLPITAMIEFREQLIVFSNNNFYRIGLNNPFDPTTWEFLDANAGIGTFSPKTVITTPYGFIFCSEQGIHMSDGRKPECLTDSPEAQLAVKNLYQRLMLNKSYIYTSLVDPGDVTDYMNPQGWNEYAELHYDSLNDELVFSTPVKKERSCILPEIKEFEFRLIFNFAKKTWRVETYKLFFDALHQYDPTADELIYNYSKRHKLSFNAQGLFTARLNELEGIYLGFYSPDINTYVDTYLSVTKQWAYSLIEGKIITHELGDSLNDYLLHSVLVSAVGRDHIDLDLLRSLKGWNDTDLLPDPIFAYELRNRQYASQATYIDWVNLVTANCAAKGSNNVFLSLCDTPYGNLSVAEATTGMIIQPEMNTGNESFTLLAPLRTPFRQARFKWCSEVVMKLKGFEFRILQKPRRTV